MSAIDEAFIVALLEEAPDGVIVLVGKSEIAAAIFRRPELADDFAGPRCFHAATGQLHRDDPVSTGQSLPQRFQYAGIVPIAPVTQTNGLFGLTRGVRQHALLARPYEVLDAIAANLALGLEAEALLDLNFYPQALAIESVLIPELLAVHRVVALVHIFQRAPPCMMYTH